MLIFEELEPFQSCPPPRLQRKLACLVRHHTTFVTSFWWRIASSHNVHIACRTNDSLSATALDTEAGLTPCGAVSQSQHVEPVVEKHVVSCQMPENKQTVSGADLHSLVPPLPPKSFIVGSSLSESAVGSSNAGLPIISPMLPMTTLQAVEKDSPVWFCETPGHDGWRTPWEPWGGAADTDATAFVPDNDSGYMPISPWLLPYDDNDAELPSLQDEDRTEDTESNIMLADTCELPLPWHLRAFFMLSWTTFLMVRVA